MEGEENRERGCERLRARRCLLVIAARRCSFLLSEDAARHSALKMSLQQQQQQQQHCCLIHDIVNIKIRLALRTYKDAYVSV